MELDITINEAGEIVEADEAWERHRRIVTLRNQAEQTFLDLGGELYWFEKEKQYRDLGHKTFESYLADPDVDLRRRLAFRLKGLYKTFCLDLKVHPGALLPAGHSKLDLIRPIATPDNVEEWVDKAAALSRSDLRLELKAHFPTLAHVAQAGGDNEWYTPPEYIRAAEKTMGGIDLDPASSELANLNVGANTFYTEEDDGLGHRWQGRVWMNPPYSQPLVAHFAQKLAAHVNQGDVPEACILVNNATETGWFNAMLDIAACVCFIRRRVKFIDQEGNASGSPLQGQVIIYIGPNVSRFAEAFSQFGRVLYARKD